MKKILFVCTGNIFRSMSAEYIMKKHIEDKNIKDFEVASAGIRAQPQEPHIETLRTLYSLGIEKIDHKQQKLTDDIIEKYDIIIAMGKDHKSFIKKEFGYVVPLFNEVAIGKKTAVLDVHEKIPDWTRQKEKANKHFHDTLIHIDESMPALITRLRKFDAELRWGKKPVDI